MHYRLYIHYYVHGTLTHTRAQRQHINSVRARTQLTVFLRTAQRKHKTYAQQNEGFCKYLSFYVFLNFFQQASLSLFWKIKKTSSLFPFFTLSSFFYCCKIPRGKETLNFVATVNSPQKNPVLDLQPFLAIKTRIK